MDNLKSDKTKQLILARQGILDLHRTGFNGTTLSFVDYVKEFPFFRDNVLPLLEEAGIRRPMAQA